MQGTRTVGSSDPGVKGGRTLRSKALVIGLLAAVAISATAFGFDAYFADASGNKIQGIWEGSRFYVVVNDPEKGACGIDEFTADLVIFDFKTGAYIEETDEVFREFEAGSGIYFWVDDAGNKQAIKVGDRYWDAPAALPPTGPDQQYQWTHILGDSLWAEGDWIYLDEDTDPDADGETDALPELKEVARVDYANYGPTYPELAGTAPVVGRFENMDTLVLIVADDTDERNIDQDQVKIVDTVATLTVSPTQLAYGCAGVCENITVTINDPDENLDCDKVDYVPFFLIINPGSWNPVQTNSATNFCMLKKWGGTDASGDVWGNYIQWYNIYNPERYIEYPGWFATTNVLPVVFFAHETDVSSGVFEYNFGNLENLMEALGLDPDVTGDRFVPGTTIAFYYLDPNDFDDFTLATAVVGDRPHSETYLTDANGVPVTQVKIGHTGLYVRVYDADANIEACCCDSVVVHLCDPHGEDDSEYWEIDEVSANSGIFASLSGMPLLPVWDAVGGYQLVFDSWTFEAFNEDTIYARYNSVVYTQESLNALGDGNPNDDLFPPVIDTDASRYQPWDVSFDLVKVYDTQVFSISMPTSRGCGENYVTTGEHKMRFVTCSGTPITGEVPLGGELGIEVTDPDQNENPLLREQVFGGWNKDADQTEGADTAANGNDEEEDSAPIWDLTATAENNVTAAADLMTPDGAISGGVDLDVLSITDIPATVKVFMWNAQRGTWERLDLRETGVNTGVFRSTTCVLVADSAHPGDGNLGSQAGDTIMAFYQDPSNHSDIAIISIKVTEGGAAGVTPPSPPTVAFDAAQYNPGDVVTITVTDVVYEGYDEISSEEGAVLVLKDATGAVLESWNSIPALSGSQFRVSYTLPEDVALGTITATYTDPADPDRTDDATAQVVAAELSDVTGISVVPNPFSTSTEFRIQAEPSGAVADSIAVTIYDLLGKKVAEVSGSDTDRVSWTGESLRNGAYIYVAVVEGADQVWTFRGFVYIKR